MSSAKGDAAWLSSSRFSSAGERSAQVLSKMRQLLADVDASEVSARPSSGSTEDLLEALLEPLRREPPAASQAAEAAFTLAVFCLAEQRPLNVIDASAGDLSDTGRLASDRTVGDKLCTEILATLHVPATAGPFQSSSYRGGYLAPQARSDSLRNYARWQSDPSRTLPEIETFARQLAEGFLAAAVDLPAWPQLQAARLTFVVYRRVRDKLLSSGSGGAFEQYLLAGLLEQELAASGSSLRIETKNVGASDRSSGAAGDIQVRSAQRLVSAIEVSASDWSTKVSQLETAAGEHLREVTVAAANAASGAELSAILEPISIRLGIDAAVVDLHSLMDVAAARVSPHARAEAFRFVYRCLVRWHSREPLLVERLLFALTSEGLAESGETIASAPEAASTPRLDWIVNEARLLYDGDQASIADVLRSVANELDPPAESR